MLVTLRLFEYKAMKKSSRTVIKEKVKNSSRYERDMEKSFAVIYHNLKRIQDEKPHNGIPRRRHSVPQIPNPALLQRYEQTTPEQRADHSTETTALLPKPRRVSFSDSVIHTFSNQSAVQEISDSRPAEQDFNLPERNRDKETPLF